VPGTGSVTREPISGTYLWFVALFQLPGVLKQRFRQREAEKLAHRPAVVGNSGGHRRSSRAIALGNLPSLAFERSRELYAQRLVWSDEVVVSAPPFDVGFEAEEGLGRAPGATDQGGDGLAQGQASP
jgi:hypothetical protein